MSNSFSEIPQYRVSRWETLAIATGAVLLATIGAISIGVKFINNAFTPERAEAMANYILDYSLPGGVRGVFSVQLSGAKVAFVKSKDNPPSTQLLVAKLPVNQATDTEWIEQIVTNSFLGEAEMNMGITTEADTKFQVTTSKIEQKILCHVKVPVMIQDGLLTQPNQSKPQMAVRYQMQVTQRNEQWIVTLLTSGQTSKQIASKIFETLQCK
jgi:DNA-binding NarL/FixJ family response regulator